MTCIEVRRSDASCYEIPGAAEPESWGEVREAMTEVESHGELVGWGEWVECFRTVDRDGLERWYFVEGEQ